MKRKAKKDFQKTKLKAGRQVTKGTNATNTSFQTRQIIVTKDRMTEAIGDKTLEALLDAVVNQSLFHKIEILHKIHNYITGKKECLFLYFPDVLSKLGYFLLESDPSVPELTVKVFTSCLKILTKAQFKTFAPSMVMHLACMMSHHAIPVKKESLRLIEALLANHPKVISQHPKILVSLLNMISVKKADKPRELVDHINNVSSSYQWRQEVFRVILSFLEAMMNPEVEDDEAEKEGLKEIHWDGETALFLPLYLARAPVKVDFEWYASNKEPEPVVLKNFVFELVQLLENVLKGEIPQSLKTNQDVILKATDIRYLNLIVQLLCYAGEWTRNNSRFGDEDVRKFYNQMQGVVSTKLFFGFPYSQHGISHDFKGKKLKEQECIQVNLGVCYLHAMFLLESDDKNLHSNALATLDYMTENFLVGNRMSDQSLLIILKMCRILMRSKRVKMDIKNGIMVGLYGILEVYKFSPHFKTIQSFFIELSLEYDCSEILETEGMQTWFTSVFKELGFMMTTEKINLEFLKYMRHLLVRKYPKVIETVNSFKNEDIFELLQCGSEEVQITVCHIVAAMDNVSADFLLDLSELISQQNKPISSKIYRRLIFVLHDRFKSREVSAKEKLQFVKFLLNVACDTRCFKYHSLEYKDSEIWDPIFETLGRTKYIIYPTKKWKTHREIFEVCLRLLMPYCEDNLMRTAVLRFSQSFFGNERYRFSTHTVLAFIQILHEVGMIFEESLMHYSCHLIFSCFVYLSLIAKDVPDQNKEFWLPELQKLLLTSLDAHAITRVFILSEEASENLTIEDPSHMTRITKLLIRKGKIDFTNNYMLNFVRRMENITGEPLLPPPEWYDVGVGNT